jgi:aminomethyltransferase
VLENDMKRTPLFKAHQQLGGKLIEFGGWEMPVHYTSITDEHLAVRKAAGLFDISHMGEVLVTGKGASDFLNRVLTNDIRKLPVGGGQYTLMCNQQGGVIDDLYAYRIGELEYLLIVNASRTAEDVQWLREQADASNVEGKELRDVSDKTAAVAVQGPKVAEFIDQVFPGPFVQGTPVTKATELKKNQAAATKVGAATVWVARTGYTGEDGFEVIAPAGEIEAIWGRILAAGAPHGLKPTGLGARDTLRTEVCFPLYGHELDENTTPIEAGLGFFVALDKGEFNGRATLAKQKQEGTTRKLVAFRMDGKSAPPRPHYPVWNAAAEPVRVGEVVSGTQSPSLGIGIGMAYVQPACAKPPTAISIEIRGTRAPATIVQKPLYRKLDGQARP